MSEINYKETLNLPKTAFEMKANLTQREPAMVERWRKEGLYQKIRAARSQPPAPPGDGTGGKGKWVLHDGPPYANGDIHMGHLLNKVLKDIVVKFRTMQGYDSPYVPGWDCHGLPIESAIQKELGPKFRELSKEEVRKRCAEYAAKYVKLQREGFERLGVFGDWERPYLTMDKRYEGGILDVLAELVKRDLVYRQKKPVHWCTFDRTALAEAELEYQNKKDNSLYVMFEAQLPKMSGEHRSEEDAALAALKTAFATGVLPSGIDPNAAEHWNAVQQMMSAEERAKIADSLPTNVEPPTAHLMIWTTTPWTLPANRAVAVHPDADYSFVQFEKDGRRFTVILASKMAERALQAAGVRDFDDIGTCKGSWLVERGYTYRHPFDPTRLQSVVLADYVTLEDGTGLVHTAPGHGKEDYQTGIKYGLEIYNPVLPDGRYDDTVPEFLRGKTIWEANALVIEKLKETGALFHHAEFAHEYPHCWRCKKPVIFRATEQWFVKASGGELSPAQLTAALATPTDATGALYDETMEKSSLWRMAVKFSYEAHFVPEWGRNRLQGMLATRPDWCISRQRSWGVPIPAFFDRQGKCLLTEASVRRCAEHFRAHGADSWYTDSPARILGLEDSETRTQGLHSLGFPGDVDVDALDKGQDILDVWFESGASHHAVLECTHPELGYPAAMYLEGSDQHRGWFQSSLLEAAGYKSEPPFKEVLTHGFIVDEKGRKMSKSEGNDIKVEAALKQYGADVLRLWVASVDYQGDVPCFPGLLAKTGEAYRKIRNTMRYLLGNLYDFDPRTDSVPSKLHSVDAWMQAKVESWTAQTLAAYDRYEFHAVFRQIYEFCNVEISAIYAKAVKDRLYCEVPGSPKRRASQTVCFEALVSLIKLSAPVLVFTAEEAWAELRKLPGCGFLEPSVHLSVMPVSRLEALARVSDNSAKRPPISARPGHTILTSSLPELENIADAVADRSTVASHWAILLPLVEKGNKQLDELKRTIGLGNPLDAEAVIVVPANGDEVAKLIGEYGPEIEDALGVGYHRVEHGEIWDIKINDTRKIYPSCARSWKRRPDVGSDKDFPGLSARDAAVVRALRKAGAGRQGEGP